MNVCDYCFNGLDILFYWTYDDHYKFCCEECAQKALEEMEDATGVYGICKVESRTQ